MLDKNFFYCYIFIIFAGFTRFYEMRWLYLYGSFKQSKWWRHKL